MDAVNPAVVSVVQVIGRENNGISLAQDFLNCGKKLDRNDMSSVNIKFRENS